MAINIPLQCFCPPHNDCATKNVILWRHSPCQTPAMINEKGDISCLNADCAPYFLQNSTFQCSDGTTWEEFQPTTAQEFYLIINLIYKTHKLIKKHFTYCTQFLMSLAQGLQAAESSLIEEEIDIFASFLCRNVVSRWIK